MQKKLIIFDLDGVIVDSIKIVSDYHAELNPKFTADIINEILCENYYEGLARCEKLLGEMVETDEGFTIFAKKKAESTAYKGIPEFLKKLHEAGHKLTINTSSNDATCVPLLVQNKILQYFDYIASADISRSKVEKFKILKDKYEVSEKDILFVTDTLGDVREADHAGIPTIGVTYGAHDKSYFAREHHGNLITIVDSVEELYNFIKNT